MGTRVQHQLYQTQVRVQLPLDYPARAPSVFLQPAPAEPYNKVRMCVKQEYYENRVNPRVQRGTDELFLDCLQRWGVDADLVMLLGSLQSTFEHMPPMHMAAWEPGTPQYAALSNRAIPWPSAAAPASPPAAAAAAYPPYAPGGGGYPAQAGYPPPQQGFGYPGAQQPGGYPGAQPPYPGAQPPYPGAGQQQQQQQPYPGAGQQQAPGGYPPAAPSAGGKQPGAPAPGAPQVPYVPPAPAHSAAAEPALRARLAERLRSDLAVLYRSSAANTDEAARRGGEAAAAAENLSSKVAGAGVMGAKLAAAREACERAAGEAEAFRAAAASAPPPASALECVSLGGGEWERLAALQAEGEALKDVADSLVECHKHGVMPAGAFMQGLREAHKRSFVCEQRVARMNAYLDSARGGGGGGGSAGGFGGGGMG